MVLRRVKWRSLQPRIRSDRRHVRTPRHRALPLIRIIEQNLASAEHRVDKMRGEGMPQIVVATDFSSCSQRALRWAGLLARQTGAELTLVHVVDDDQPETMIVFEKQEADKFLKEQIDTLAELSRLPGRRHHGRGLRRHPASCR